MNIDQKLDALKNIERVDAPHFLPTRIKQRINSLDQSIITTQWKLAFATTFVIIFALNVSVVFKNLSNQKKEVNIEKILTKMDLSNSNQLYNE